MAVLANNIPGPAVFENLDNFSFKMLKHYQEKGIDKIDVKIPLNYA
jgi:hypothetical protein